KRGAVIGSQIAAVSEQETRQEPSKCIAAFAEVRLPWGRVWFVEEEQTIFSVPGERPFAMLFANPNAGTSIRNCHTAGSRVEIRETMHFDRPCLGSLRRQHWKHKPKLGFDWGQARDVAQQISEGLLIQVVQPTLRLSEVEEPVVS